MLAGATVRLTGVGVSELVPDALLALLAAADPHKLFEVAVEVAATAALVPERPLGRVDGTVRVLQVVDKFVQARAHLPVRLDRPVPVVVGALAALRLDLRP